MMSRRIYEQKVREEQEAAAHVFQDFIETFQNFNPAPTKTFVKSGVLHGDRKMENVTEIYSPKPVIAPGNTNNIKSALECAKILKENKLDKPKKEKPKSNLEQLKEELKMRHSERDERERLKEEISMGQPALSYFEGGDPNSTNLFLANLGSKITENELMKEFGQFGALASVKIMWPRGDDRHRSSTNCGFVAYMSRKDAERALNIMRHRTDMRVGWGKSVELPPHPIYVPNELLKLYLPPPPSGLPFNAQPPKDEADHEFDDLLCKSAVKVTIPLNKKVLSLVNRVVEFVVREGPMFEAMLMNKEINNPEFNFLFDFKSPVHVYYRWKLFSVLHGDSTRNWNMAPFRMFAGGSVWLPPISPNYSDGMPDRLVQEKSLSENQCERLIALLQELTLNRLKVAEAMVFCMNHILSIKDSLQIIAESLTSAHTKPIQKIARLYLLSDILSNCKIKNIEYSAIGEHVVLTIYNSLRDCYESLSRETDRNNFRSKVLRVVQQWDCYKIFSESCVKNLELFFIEDEALSLPEEGNSSSDDEPLDGNSLLKRSLKSGSSECVSVNTKPALEKENRFEYFVPSKWDTLDPEEVNSQAVSTKEIFLMELEKEADKQKIETGNHIQSNSEKSPKKVKKNDKCKCHKNKPKNRSRSRSRDRTKEKPRDRKKSIKRDKKYK